MFLNWRLSAFQPTRAMMFAIAFVTAISSGCGGSRVPGTTVQTAEQSLMAAKEALAASDFSTAEAQFDASLRGGLNADLSEEARLGRVRALIELDKLDDAEMGLNELAQEAADVGTVWLERSRLALRRGDRPGAVAAFAEAKKRNPKAIAPDGLKE